VASDDVAVAAQQAGLDAATTTALVEDYEAAQLMALKSGVFLAWLLVLATLLFTRNLPHTRPPPVGEAAPAAAPA
jgi:hypothetical protein